MLPSGEDAEWVFCYVRQREEGQETQRLNKRETKRDRRRERETDGEKAVRREFELLISYNYRNIAMSSESPEAYPPSFHLLPSVYHVPRSFPSYFSFRDPARCRAKSRHSLPVGTPFRNPISGLFPVKRPIYQANLN